MRRILAPLALWIVAAQTVFADDLAFCYDPYPPYTLGDEGTPSGGLKVELLEAVVDQIDGLGASVTLLPWKRCQSVVRDGAMDGILPLFRNAERETYMALTDGAIQQRTTFWHRTGAFEAGFAWTGNYEELAHLRLGMLNGSYIDTEMETAFEEQRGITRARDMQTLMELLLRERVDLVAVDHSVARYILRTNGWEGQMQPIGRPIVEKMSYFGLSKASGADRHLEAFNAAIATLKEDGTFDAILARIR